MPARAKLIPIKTIGDERDNYTFFLINGAAISEQKDIYVLDAKGVFLARYDWGGKFIARTGSSGKGPGDFYYPDSLQLADNNLYVLDKGNYRIAEVGLNLNSVNYYRISPEATFYSQCIPLKSKTFLGNFSRHAEKRGKIGIINRDGKVLSSFFNQYPIAMELNAKYSNPGEIQLHKFRVHIETIPVMGIDEGQSRVLVTFNKPDNPVVFYVYGMDGKLIKRFQYAIKEERYKLSDFYLKASWKEIADPAKIPKEEFIPMVQSVYIFKKHYVAFFSLNHLKKKQIISSRKFCVIFDLTGKVVQRLKIDDGLKVLSLSWEGYVLAAQNDEEISKLYVFELRFQADR